MPFVSRRMTAPSSDLYPDHDTKIAHDRDNSLGQRRLLPRAGARVCSQGDHRLQVLLGLGEGSLQQAWASGDAAPVLDLYAGPGCYDDGSVSTPLLVLEKAIADERFRSWRTGPWPPPTPLATSISS